MMSRLLAISSLVLACACYAQELPSNWQSLPPDEFAVIARAFLNTSPPPGNDQIRPLIIHAWEQFLSDEDFIENADWATVQELAATFGQRWNTLPDAVSTLTPPERVLAFRTALAARAQQVPISNMSFEQMVATHAALRSAGVGQSELAAQMAAWMDANVWKELSLSDRIALSELLHSEIMPVARFSARWSGSLTAPTSGNYTFAQLRQHHIDGTLKLTLDGQILFDSSRSRELTENESLEQIESDPVAMTAGRPVSLVAEFQFDAESMILDREFAERVFPMVVVTWSRDGGEPEIIPVQAYRTAEGAEGLAGEYFGDRDFQGHVAARTDPGLQMIWSEKQILSEYRDRQEEVVQNCLVELLGINSAATIEDYNHLVDVDLPRLLKRLSASDRIRVLEWLTKDVSRIGEITPFGIRSLFPHLFMLPAPVTEEFFVTWFEGRLVSPAPIALYLGWEAGSFNADAYDQYGWVGHFLRKGNWPVAQTLIDDCLEREDRSCNLMVPYCLSYGMCVDGTINRLIVAINSRLEDPTIQGDQRASWLAARGYVEELNIGGMPRPNRGMEFWQEASLKAESPAQRFFILREMIARFASLDKADVALSLLEDSRGRLPEYSAQFDQLRADIEELAAHYRSQRGESTGRF